MTYIANGSVYDDFRPLAVGTSIPGRVSDSGHTWVNLSSRNWQVVDLGLAGHSVRAISGSRQRVGIEFGTADVDVEVVLQDLDTQSAGLSIRNSVFDYYRVSAFGDTQVDVILVQGAAETILATYTSLNLSDEAWLRCVASGSTLTTYLDGVQLGSVTDSTITGTNHGMFCRFGGGGYNFYAFNMHPPPEGGWQHGGIHMDSAGIRVGSSIL